MAGSGSRTRRRRNRRRGGNGLPPGAAMGALLLAVAGLVIWYFWSVLDPRPDVTGSASADSPGRPAKAPVSKPAKPVTGPVEPPAEAADRFEFYEMLPDAEVQVGQEPESPGVGRPPPVTVPGTYVIQAGAFPDFAEADKVKARLALLGIVSEIQAAESNGEKFHRVRIGPMENLNELNRLRDRLRQSDIDYLVIPVGE